jgi:hypothetical protein
MFSSKIASDFAKVDKRQSDSPSKKIGKNNAA